MAAAYPGAPESINEIVAVYEKQIVELEASVQGMTPEQLRARPVPGKWTTLELLCHLSDSEQVLADRLKRAIAQPNTLLMAYDESKYVESLAYDRRDPKEELDVIRATRRQLVRILKGLPTDAWNRVGVHSERGLNSVKDIAQTAVGHLKHHMPFLIEKRKAMGL